MPHIFDTRMAWTGSFAHAPEVPMRMEACFWKGRLTSFDVAGDWAESSPVPVRQAVQIQIEWWIYIASMSLLLAAATLLAWKNFRLGRGDPRGARRLAVFMLITGMLRWACLATHHTDPAEYDRIFRGFADALLTACAFGVFYLALEPLVRRKWPQTLMTWTRLLAGGAKDPLVAGHGLIGVLVGVGLSHSTNAKDNLDSALIR